LVEEFGWGGYTPQQLHKIASLAEYGINAGANVDLSRPKQLATLGANGTISGNMARDLVRGFPETNMPKTKSHRIPIRHKVLGRGRPLMPFLYPHAVFAALYHHYPAVFETRIKPPGECERFWREVSGGPGDIVKTFWKFKRILKCQPVTIPLYIILEGYRIYKNIVARRLFFPQDPCRT
jgi:hypothetical protein